MNKMLKSGDDMPDKKGNGFSNDFYTQCIDDVPCMLKEPFDMSFIKKYGKVFKVYDDQDSGNTTKEHLKNGSSAKTYTW